MWEHPYIRGLGDPGQLCIETIYVGFQGLILALLDGSKVGKRNGEFLHSLVLSHE